MTESAQVRLLDFGVAKLLEGPEAAGTSLTSIYGRALTPDYASPELLCGALVDERSDVYSLGVLLYELLTGVRPYRLKSATSMGLLERAIGAIEIRKPSTLPSLPASAARVRANLAWARQLRGDLDAIALKALNRAPSDRYQSVAAFAEDIGYYLAGKPIQALPGRIADRLYKFLLRNKTAAAAAAMALAAIIITVGTTVRREVATRSKDAASAPGLRTSGMTDTLTAVAAVPERSVAVLPFADMSEKKIRNILRMGLPKHCSIFWHRCQISKCRRAPPHSSSRAALFSSGI